MTVSTPPGFSAALRGVPYCPESAIAQVSGSAYSGLLERMAPTCPAASRVGSAFAAAGAGSKPFNVSGQVYLAGPYKGAPVSLVVVIPAVSGPYDLGNVVVRVATRVDPETARVTAVSDPLPQILGGVVLRAKSVRIDLDRPHFTINPTNCDRFAVEAQIEGDEGARAVRRSPYQVANCATLPYSPKLSITMEGGVQRRGHPAIHAEFKGVPGQANTRKVSVVLPKGQLLDNNHIETVCTRVQFANEGCPSGSSIGVAKATSPLLDKPLSGQVYLRSSNHKLPDLVVDLKGQIDLELSARIDSVGGRLRTIFDSVPDVPVSEFTLDLLGGKRGLLQNSEGLCGSPKRATARLTAQNGDALSYRPRVRIECGSGERPKRRGKTGRGA